MIFMKKFFQLIKPIVLTIIMIGFMQMTGIWGGATAMAQMLVIKMGILNVDVEEIKSPAKFDYSFSIQDLEGVKVAFNDFKGKVLFINLWATWCGPCRAEMPGIQSLSEKLKAEHVEFIMISLDKEATLPKVKSYIENNQFTFPVFMPHKNIPEQFQVPSIPTTFIVGKDGKILMKEIGTRNYDTRNMVDFLKEQASK